jgi:hypothetical protein
MRVRVLLLVSALATVVAAVGAGGASAATLFTTNSHLVRVSVGSIADATSIAPLDVTVAGTLAIRCTHSSLTLRVDDNGQTSGRVAITVTAATVAPGCAGGQLALTTTTPWLLTLRDHSTMVGAETVFRATLHGFRMDAQGVPGLIAGNLESGVTAVQPTATTFPISFVFDNAAGASSPTVGQVQIDARYVLTGDAVAATWSLTDT